MDISCKGSEETFWENGNVLQLDCGGEYVCPKSLSCAFQMGAFYYSSLYLSRAN